jgi:hypothetical protein
MQSTQCLQGGWTGGSWKGAGLQRKYMAPGESIRVWARGCALYAGFVLRQSPDHILSFCIYLYLKTALPLCLSVG